MGDRCGKFFFFVDSSSIMIGPIFQDNITHNIYQLLDDGLEARAVFLDISKTFDKVWHEGLLFKLKQNGISGNLLNVITDFLYQRKQRVVLNGQHSSWTNVEAGGP